MNRITATVWNPWGEMHRLRSEMDQLFNQEWWPTARRPAAFPAINAFEDQGGLLLTAELPGVDASQLDVAVERDSITVSGRRSTANPPTADENYVRRERWFEPFQRTVELPFDVDADKCEATYEKGVLTIRLRRAPEHGPKKLAIQSAAPGSANSAGQPEHKSIEGNQTQVQ